MLNLASEEGLTYYEAWQNAHHHFGRFERLDGWSGAIPPNTRVKTPGGAIGTFIRAKRDCRGALIGVEVQYDD